MSAYLQPLQQLHDARVAKSPAWNLMLDELTQYKMMRDKTSVSLNLAARETERKQLDAMQASFRVRHKAIDGSDASLSDDRSLDDGLDANERSLKTELKAESDAKKAKDVQLNETAHILYDAVGMINANPKLAAEVLPYGGKFSSSYTAAVAPPAAPPAAPPPAVTH
jgi:carboxyl-terminal processing protease